MRLSSNDNQCESTVTVDTLCLYLCFYYQVFGDKNDFFSGTLPFLRSLIFLLCFIWCVDLDLVFEGKHHHLQRRMRVSPSRSSTSIGMRYSRTHPRSMYSRSEVGLVHKTFLLVQKVTMQVSVESNTFVFHECRPPGTKKTALSPWYMSCGLPVLDTHNFCHTPSIHNASFSDRMGWLMRCKSKLRSVLIVVRQHSCNDLETSHVYLALFRHGFGESLRCRVDML